MTHTSEPILEPIARWQRFTQMKPWLLRGWRVVDFGCGPTAPLFRAFPVWHFRQYIGLDPLAPAAQLTPTAHVVQSVFEKTHLAANSADAVTLSAVLEHVDDPLQILQEAHRVLRRGGVVVLTTPSWRAKPVLEFLSFRLGIISRREIEEHKRYFTCNEVREFLFRAGFRAPKVRYFELGCNVFAVAKK